MQRRVTYLLAGALAAFSCGCAHYRSAPIDLKQAGARLEARSFNDPGLKSFVSEQRGREAAQWPPPVWDFETLSLAGVYFHPSLDLARAQWEVAAAGKQTASARPNPSANFTPGYNFGPDAGISPWMPGLGFDLPLETAGKRRKRLNRAEYLAEAARLNISTIAWQVRSNVRAALINVVASGQRLKLVEEQQREQRKTVEILEQRLAVGSISAFDVSSVQVSLVKLQADLAESRRVNAENRSLLAESLGISLREVEHLSVDYLLAGRLIATLPTKEAQRGALQHRADILAALATYEASQVSLQLEIARQYPDLHLGNSYQWDQGANKWSLSLTLELPVLNQNQGPIAEAEARRKEAVAQILSLQAKVLADVDRANKNVEILGDQLNAVQLVYAATGERLDRLRQQVEAGQSDRLEYQTATLELIATKQTVLDIQIKTAQAIGVLEDTLQIPIVAFSNLEQGRKEISP